LTVMASCRGGAPDSLCDAAGMPRSETV